MYGFGLLCYGSKICGRAICLTVIRTHDNMIYLTLTDKNIQIIINKMYENIETYLVKYFNKFNGSVELLPLKNYLPKVMHIAVNAEKSIFL